MKTFYLLRHSDVHGNSGIGVVAEGVIFDSKLCAMTWNTEIPTVTTFRNIADVKKLHGHEGRTEVVVEGKHPRFEECKQILKDLRKRNKEKREEARTLFSSTDSGEK